MILVQLLVESSDSYIPKNSSLSFLLKPHNYISDKGQCPNICSVSNNLIGRGLLDVVDAMQVQLTFRGHNKTPSFGGSPVNCLNDINQLDIYIDKHYLREDRIRWRTSCLLSIAQFLGTGTRNVRFR